MCEFPAGSRSFSTLLHQCPRQPPSIKNKFQRHEVARAFECKVGQTKLWSRPVGSSNGNRERRRRHPVGEHQDHCALLSTLDRFESSSSTLADTQEPIPHPGLNTQATGHAERNDPLGNKANALNLRRFVDLHASRMSMSNPSRDAERLKLISTCRISDDG